MRYISNKHEFDAADPKDAAIILLTTKLNTLEERLKNQGGSGSNKDGSGLLGGTKNDKSNKNNKQNDGLPEWCTKFKGQKNTHEGKEYVWCKEYKCDGKYNGLYMLFPHDHATWLEIYRKNVAKKGKVCATPGIPGRLCGLGSQSWG
eukprot:1415091-Ditylum_brightwellii.AAC.1